MANGKPDYSRKCDREVTDPDQCWTASKRKWHNKCTVCLLGDSTLGVNKNNKCPSCWLFEYRQQYPGQNPCACTAFLDCLNKMKEIQARALSDNVNVWIDNTTPLNHMALMDVTAPVPNAAAVQHPPPPPRPPPPVRDQPQNGNQQQQERPPARDEELHAKIDRLELKLAEVQTSIENLSLMLTAQQPADGQAEGEGQWWDNWGRNNQERVDGNNEEGQ